MRGMIKWRPFNSLLNNKDIKEIEKNRLKITKPIIMEDRIIEINEILTNALNNNLNIKIKHYSIKSLKITTGKIEKINIIEKYILINKTRIYFKNIILVDYL